MNYEDVITGQGIEKKFKNFELNIPELHIPKGFSTALIGENGAGKTTLLNILAGIRRDSKGDIRYFEQKQNIEDALVKERIGFTGTKNFFMGYWNGDQVKEMMSMLFDSFDADKFDGICRSLNIDSTIFGKRGKSVSKLSDGNRMKLMLATVFARNTDILILDEPASPLDPLMRDMLGDMIRAYLAEGDGLRSVVFSTHNVSDMENVTDYIIIIDDGKILEEGFVTDLKEKYILVKGEREDLAAAEQHFITCQSNSFGFEGVALTDNMNKFAGMDVEFDTPNLFNISVAVMKQNSKLTMPVL